MPLTNVSSGFATDTAFLTFNIRNPKSDMQIIWRNLNIFRLKRVIIFQTSIIRFHVPFHVLFGIFLRQITWQSKPTSHSLDTWISWCKLVGDRWWIKYGLFSPLLDDEMIRLIFFKWVWTTITRKSFEVEIIPVILCFYKKAWEDIIWYVWCLYA